MLESTVTLTSPVTGSLVSMRMEQPVGGRATAMGKPLAAVTVTDTTRAMTGKMSWLQKSKDHCVAADCVRVMEAREPPPPPWKELPLMSVPVISRGPVVPEAL